MESGKGRRYHRLLGTQDRTLMVATDDGLISGPMGLLSRMGEILKETTDADGVLMYKGCLERNWQELGQRAAVVNLTASVKGKMHTEKIMCGTVSGAVRSGADWVAAHVNVGSMFENKMIKNLAKIVEDASKLGIPVLGIMYPREEGSEGDENHDEEKRRDNGRYVKRVAHAARIGAELGVDLIKTQYPGTGEGFRKVVEATGGVPVITAGGPLRDMAEVLNEAREVMRNGGAGVSFGRNLFQQTCPREVVARLRRIVDDTEC